jgi:hypothetical protein
MRTKGISPKAVLAAVFPMVGTAVMALLHGTLDPAMDPTLVAGIVGVVDALLALAGAYLGNPGNVVPVDDGFRPGPNDTPMEGF